MITPVLPLHGLGGAQDLPLPAPLAIAGGGAALVLSFCVLGLAWRKSRYDGRDRERVVPPGLASVLDHAAWEWFWRVVGLVFFGWVTWALVAGADRATNPALGTFYVLVWVGIVPLSLAFGRVARALSPVRTLTLLLSRATGTDPRKGLFTYPERLGYWPGAVMLFAYVWQELVNPDQVMLFSVRLWLAAYLAIMIVGSTLFGDRWLSRADPFEVYSDLVARLSVWGRDRQDRRVIRSPLANLAHTPPLPGLLAVVAVLFGSTAFDSAREMIRWVQFIEENRAHEVLINTTALLGFCVVVGVSFQLAAMATQVDLVPRRDLPRLLAHSVIPIIVGYMFAHYLSYFVEQGQATVQQLSDPLVRGDDYIGTAGMEPNLWLSLHPTFLAVTKVLGVVLGHLVAVVAAHDRAVRLLPARAHVTGQIGMLLVMVGYTISGLYLLFGT